MTMNETMIALRNMGCKIGLRSAYYSDKWLCEINWSNEEGDKAAFEREADTPEEALNLAREAFERTARRGLPISQIVDHSSEHTTWDMRADTARRTEENYTVASPSTDNIPF